MSEYFGRENSKFQFFYRKTRIFSVKIQTQNSMQTVIFATKLLFCHTVFPLFTICNEKGPENLNVNRYMCCFRHNNCKSKCKWGQCNHIMHAISDSRRGTSQTTFKNANNY